MTVSAILPSARLRLPGVGRLVLLVPIAALFAISFAWPLITILLRSFNETGRADIASGLFFGNYTSIVLDDLLRQVAGRLKKACRQDMVARLGGDEFTILIRKATRSGACETATAVLSALDEPFRIGGRQVTITASIGVSLYPEHGSDAQQLLRNADAAMYAAKANGKRQVQFWSPADAGPLRASISPETRSALMTLAGIQSDPNVAGRALAAPVSGAGAGS